MATSRLTRIAEKRQRAERIYERLQEAYPDAACALDYRSPLELLVATILAAQCTDKRVNQITPELFKKYRTPQDYLDVPQSELEDEIRTCGFFRQKAKSIVNACRGIVDRFGGEVPGTIEELVTLDGVGRKTANVVLGECFDTPAIIVDTHCKRVAYRLDFTRNTDPDKIEKDLQKLWPEVVWTQYSHCIVFHGRSVCVARSPRCSQCPLGDTCRFPSRPEGKRIAT